MRVAECKRTTKETDVSLSLNLDGTGASEIATGCGFLDHMLTLFAKHAGFDLSVTCRGDVEVDDHHSVEDIGICLGDAFRRAVGDCKGITRYGDIVLPMDEALVLAATDISGRAYLAFNVTFASQKIGTFDTELVEEFWMAFVRKAEITLHVRQLDGKNSHHVAEAVFKSVARALSAAIAFSERAADGIPSTKGVLL